MVNSSGQDDHIFLDERDTNPLVVLSPDIKVPLAIENVPNLLVLVQVLREERLDLLLVDISHSGRRDTHLVAIPVSAVCRDGINGLNCWAVNIGHA